MPEYAQRYRRWSKNAQDIANAIFLPGGDLTDYAIASNLAEIYALKAQREEEMITREREHGKLKASEQRRVRSLLNRL